MAKHTLPGLGLTGGYADGEDGWGSEQNANLLKISTLLQGGVINRLAAVPGSPAEGDAYILTAAPNANTVAVYDAAAWTYYAPVEGWLLYDRTANKFVSFDGGAWVVLATGSGGGGGIDDAPSDGKVYGRKNGSWVEIVSGGGGGTEVPAIVRSRAYTRKSGTSQELTWIPKVGNMLVAFVIGRDFGGQTLTSGWVSLGKVNAGFLDGSYAAARIVQAGDTTTIAPNTAPTNGVSSMIVFEIDAAYIPAAGLADLDQADITYSDTKFPDTTVTKKSVILLAAGGGAGGSPIAFVIPTGGERIGTTLVTGGYIDGAGIDLVVDPGTYTVTYSNFDAGSVVNFRLVLDSVFA